MKRIFTIFLTLLILLPLVVSCSSSQLTSPQTEEITKETETKIESESKTDAEEPKTREGYLPQSQFEQNVTKILILGNSHSNDLFFQLARIFAAQGFEGRYTLGFLYYSGCPQYKHVEFCKTNAEEYDYYESNATDYTRVEYCTMQYALEKHQWDVIFFQSGGADWEEDTLAQKYRDELMALVDQYVPTEHVFGWHASWPSPNDSQLWSDTWWRKPPEGQKDKLIRRYGLDPVRQFNHYIDLTTKNISTDPRYAYVFSAGSAILYANRILDVSQLSLYRDYTHLSDFGRIIAAYSFYAQFTGKPIEEVKLDVLPAKKRQSHYQADGDLILNDTMKEIIKECANYSLENTWTVPGA